MVANKAPQIAFLKYIFLFGASLYNARKTIKNMIEDISQRNVSQTDIKLSDKLMNENKYMPIIRPKIGSKKAIQMMATIATVRIIAMHLAVKNDRSSSTSYALLKARINALTP